MGSGIIVAIFALLAWVAIFLLLGALVKVVCARFFDFSFGAQVEKLYIAAVALAAIAALIGIMLGIYSVPVPFFGR